MPTEFTRYEIVRACNPRAFTEWRPNDDRKLLRLIKARSDRWGRHQAPNWGAIAHKLQRTILAVQSRATILRAAPRLAARCERSSELDKGTS